MPNNWLNNGLAKSASALSSSRLARALRFTAIELKSDHVEIFCVPKIYLKKERIEGCEMKKRLPDNVTQIVDEIISQMPLEEKVSLANMENREVEVLQGVFDLYIRDKIDPEDEDRCRRSGIRGPREYRDKLRSEIR